MQSSNIKRLKQMIVENRKLKQMYAQLCLTSQLKQEIIKSYNADRSS